MLKKSIYSVSSESYLDERDGHYKRLLFSTRSGGTRALGVREHKLLEEGRASALPESMLTDLLNLELVVPEDEDELAIILKRNAAAAEDSKSLYQVVMPSAACQKGCSYCSQIHAGQELSTEDQDALIKRLRQKLGSSKYESLRIAWFGAEPLLGLRVIRRLTPRLKSLASEFGVCYSAKMVSNGLALTPNVLSELVQEHNLQSVEITLDGSAPFHDRSRPTKGGQGTYRQIFDHVIAAALRDDLETRITVRCNVSRENVDGVKPLLRELAAAGVQDRISFYVAPVHAWGNDADGQALGADEFANLEIEWFAEMAKLGFHVNPLPKRKHVLCLATMPQGELVDAYGQLFKCTEVPYLAAYGPDHEYALGNLRQPTDIDQTDLAMRWSSSVASHEFPCSTCEMLPVCGGGCPKLWREGKRPCPAAKHNIRERLLLKLALSRLESETSTLA